MTEQQPLYFTDLDKTFSMKRYAVQLVELPEAPRDKDRCLQLKGNRLCGEKYLDISACEYCGLPTCEHHMAVNTTQQMRDMCQSCAALPTALRDQIRAFRLEVNQ